MWNKYRGVDIEKEASSAEFKLLEAALREKEESPLAATMAALLLLRGHPASSFTIGHVTSRSGFLTGLMAVSFGLNSFCEHNRIKDCMKQSNGFSSSNAAVYRIPLRQWVMLYDRLRNCSSLPPRRPMSSKG